MASTAHLPNDDDQTAALIRRLQIEDIQDIHHASKGKSRERETDEEYALKLYLEELSAEANIATERRDLRQAAALEELGQSQERPEAASSNDGFSDISQADWSSSDLEFAPLYWNGTSVQSHAGESSSRGPSSAVNHKGKPSSIYQQCAACLEDKKHFECARTPCGHYYCADCIEHLFLDAVKDETLYPPRCCRTEIPLDSARKFLSMRTERDFMRKAPEWETKNRTYCARPKCSAWIRPHRIRNDLADCPSCRSRTCTICKAGAHGDRDCPQDKETQQLLEMGQDNKWQRCHQCRRLISLSSGCYHMT
ncbi:hypothetical protein IWX90DRAFT_475043 [Phyllosticta citrichinensis]|uniref:RBR-type E3 ubiquitin transferase n=1 Tax=Phyllosticta citrichinensis TaxID=1130410 RepID=A0ABR1Y1P8_9PEZI